MSKIRVLFRFFVLLTFVLTLSAVAHAQASRTWVSGVGDDVNPCSRTAPCKTFAGAISKTAVNGEIDALDPGGFGTVTITKSITIDGAGTHASILNAGIGGVTVNYDLFTAVGEIRKTVRLRNLSLNGFDTGTSGVRIVGGAASAGSEVFVENCVIDGNYAGTGRGISDERGGGGELFVTGTTVRNMLGTGIVVIPANNGATRLDAAISDVRVENCAYGIVASSGARISVSDSVVSGNTNHAIGVEGPFGASEMHVASTRISGNGTGISQAFGGTVRLSDCDVVFNTVNGATGTVFSYGNNRFAGNGGSSAVTPVGVQSHGSGQQ
ncbi:MAG TPA: right-handed parallel beta-helix repeat-containing protein [Pyrinomonadaceae bacterium]|jgi:hypothetical protein